MRGVALDDRARFVALHGRLGRGTVAVIILVRVVPDTVLAAVRGVEVDFGALADSPTSDLLMLW